MLLVWPSDNAEYGSAISTKARSSFPGQWQDDPKGDSEMSELCFLSQAECKGSGTEKFQRQVYWHLGPQFTLPV